MRSLDQSSRDFDKWALAVRQQMLASLEKRRQVLQPESENVIIVKQIQVSDGE
ncbi:MAG: hypothetical protein AAF827_21120 [Cyanobacteria bacterium P01_D01_bin.6]